MEVDMISSSIKNALNFGIVAKLRRIQLIHHAEQKRFVNLLEQTRVTRWFIIPIPMSQTLSISIWQIHKNGFSLAHVKKREAYSKG